MTLKRVILATFVMLAGVIGAGLAALGQAPAAKPGGPVPTFQADPTWPPALPNNWVMGAVASVAVDRRDHVWLLHRPRTVAAGAENRAAPPVLEFEASGKFIQGWGGPSDSFEWPDNEHGIYLDDKDVVWIGGNAGTGANLIKAPWRDDDMLLKFTMQGTFLQQFGRRDQSRGNSDTKNLKEPADVVVYRKTNEAFVADGYGNRRVIVLDANTGAFKRMWGAFGKAPVDGPQAPPAGAAATPPPPLYTEPGPPQFSRPVHSLEVSNDGLLYVSDRGNGRIQVFTIAGTYVKQLFINPRGIPGAVALSPDPQQQFLYVGDSGNSRILVVNRKSLEIVSEFVKKGSLSPHHMATDSKGNIYTAETGRGTQRFLFKGMSPRATQ
jgi:DNA-binding beta-propeller fold protein YncE